MPKNVAKNTIIVYNIENMRNNEKVAKKVVKSFNRLLLVLMLACSLLLLGFTEFDSDGLYSYQWGFKNNGNFFVNNQILDNDYVPLYFNKQYNDTLFYDDVMAVNYLKAIDSSGNNTYAVHGFDSDWENAYTMFKNVPASRQAIVAVIDTGIDISHNELVKSIWINKHEIPANGIDDDYNGYIDDVNGYNFHHRNGCIYVDPTVDVHGTHAAGIIAAEHNNGGIKGIAYDEYVKVMPLKVLDANENGYVSSVVNAIYYARDNGANICNISLGAYSYDASIDQAIKSCPNMVFVVSAGNGANFKGYSLDDRDVYPAKLNYPNIITVSNYSFDGNRYLSANYGSYVDVFAPGTFILSTTPQNNYAYLTGTSMSAPFVSAACAMIYSRYPNVPISSYKSIIINGATPVNSLMGLSKSAGILNIYNSLVIASAF